MGLTSDSLLSNYLGDAIAGYLVDDAVVGAGHLLTKVLEGERLPGSSPLLRGPTHTKSSSVLRSRAFVGVGSGLLKSSGCRLLLELSITAVFNLTSTVQVSKRYCTILHFFTTTCESLIL